MQAEAPPQVAAVTQHQGEEPHHAQLLRLVVEGELEVGEVHLCLLPRLGLEAHFEPRDDDRAHLAHEVTQHGASSCVAQGPDLAQQSWDGQLGKRRQALTHVGLVGADDARTWLAWAVLGWLHATSDVFANGLAVQACALGNRRHRQALFVQIQNHDQLPQFDHAGSPRSGDCNGS